MLEMLIGLGEFSGSAGKATRLEQGHGTSDLQRKLIRRRRRNHTVCTLLQSETLFLFRWVRTQNAGSDVIQHHRGRKG